MPLPIQDYALIGDGHTAALVGRDGSIDWLCLPRFDSPACFAALLGTPDHGHWQIAPLAETRSVQRRYRPGSLVLETDSETDDGAIRLIDCMPLENNRLDLVRIVEGLRGTVRVRMQLAIRFDYGSVVPWVRNTRGAMLATAGPDTLELVTEVPTHGEHMTTVAEFDISAGERKSFVLNYRASHKPMPPAIDAGQALRDTEARWREWSQRCSYQGRWQLEVTRSLIILKALIYKPTGGIVAAPTTSLPEHLGGNRNWDYRFCWLRDATFTLNALLLAGYVDEALAWREWLLHAVAGSPADLQIMYSVTGQRRLDESELPWLPGYLGAAPVRIGNAASKQFQLDVFGEVMDSLHLARSAGMVAEHDAWQLQLALLKFLSEHWQDPDEGIWEVRGPRQHFTHSKVMAWVAFDRAVKAVEVFGLEGPVDEWRRTRDQIHEQVCTRGFDSQRNTFVQYYGGTELDASLLLIAQVGFMASDDPRLLGTIDAITRGLAVDGLLLRYATSSGVDNLPPGEGVFLACSFWLVDALAVTGQRDAAEALFERLLGLANDVGLLAEEYDPRGGHMLGNFPQALSHMALIHSARLLSMSSDSIEHAGEEGERPALATRDGAPAGTHGLLAGRGSGHKAGHKGSPKT
ncbi:MAG: glycoside hydrolase family 15 protein [Rubrivivax sp.]